MWTDKFFTRPRVFLKRSFSHNSPTGGRDPFSLSNFQRKYLTSFLEIFYIILKSRGLNANLTHYILNLNKNLLIEQLVFYNKNHQQKPRNQHLT